MVDWETLSFGSAASNKEKEWMTSIIQQPGLLLEYRNTLRLTEWITGWFIESLTVTCTAKATNLYVDNCSDSV